MQGEMGRIGFKTQSWNSLAITEENQLKLESG
jgi:hypothetical protein